MAGIKYSCSSVATTRLVSMAPALRTLPLAHCRGAIRNTANQTKDMELEKRSRSESKTKEKERSKGDTKARRSTERNKAEADGVKREKTKNGDEKKLSKTAKAVLPPSKFTNDIMEDGDAKKKRPKGDSKERKDAKPKKAETNSKPPEPAPDKSKKSSKHTNENAAIPGPTASNSKPATNESSHRWPSSSKSKAPVIVAKEDDEYNYEDDFEDYEDDFEEEEEDALDQKTDSRHNDARDEIRRPKNAKMFSSTVERETGDQSDVSTSRAATAASESSVDTRPRTVQSRINFDRAHITEAQLASYGKVRNRAKELTQLIELDAVSYDLFDMAPVRDYDFFMQNFGKSNMVQVQVQTGDDSVDREGQTEELDLENKWSQHPPTDIYGCGGDQAINDDDVRTRMKFDSELLNSVRFRRFVERSGALIAELFSDEYVSQEPTFQTKSSMSFSSAYSTISLGPLAKKCTVGNVAFSDGQSTIIAILFYIHESPLEDITGKTLVTVWNITDLGAPFKLLVCDGQSKACCFSPDRPAAVFAGLSDSSIVAWDLQESDSLHPTCIPWKDIEVTLRQPTYDSAFLCKETRNDSSPVVEVAALNSAGKAASNQTVDTYQLITLHSDGSIRIWTALMTLSKEPSELDLGLRPGGRLKLVQSAVLKPPLAALRNICGDTLLRMNDVDAFCLGWTAETQSDFYVGTGTGYILHLTRHEGKSGPTVYQPDLEALTDVLCVDFSPFESSVLLTGCSDGCIRLYKTSYSRPLAALALPSSYKEIAKTSPVRFVQWSPVSPYLFYSLHGDSALATWDLKNDRQAPVNVEKCPKTLISFRISSTVALGSGPAYFVALSSQDGLIEVHQLRAEGGKTKYSKTDGAKLLKLIEMM